MLVHSQSFEAEEAKSIERAQPGGREASNESNELLAVRLKASNEETCTHPTLFRITLHTAYLPFACAAAAARWESSAAAQAKGK